MQFRMLDTFKSLFAGHVYKHRIAGQGDAISRDLYEDLYSLQRSRKFNDSVDRLVRGLNLRNVRQGIAARRGDGTFGQLVPGQEFIRAEGWVVPRGRVATLDIGVEVKILNKGCTIMGPPIAIRLDIGVEVKILNKAMIKQINDRISGLQSQAEYFRRGRDGRQRGNPITVAVVGVNCADYTVGYEGDRSYRTDGSPNQPHPSQEAPEIVRRLDAEVRPAFDEMILLRYKATNENPFPFEWDNQTEAYANYAASLVRIASEFDHRF
jgi:hypothetical protein